jgi:H+-transporting ATPase
MVTVCRVGAREMAARGVLVTRLSAIEEAASLDVLCTDKTGTLTLNQLRVGQLVPSSAFSEDDLLRYGAIASDAASQDPLDLAILTAYDQRARPALPERLSFTPFDPRRKRTEATIEQDSAAVTVTKCASQVVAALASSSDPVAIEAEATQLAARGFRVLAVAAGSEHTMRVVGLIGLSDQPRPDSTALLASLHAPGVQTKMLTGDSVETVRAVASQVGIAGRMCDAAALQAQGAHLDTECAVLAGIFPEDKICLVQALQREQHSVGMTGDGVNDAPALKQAEVGIAVSQAVDVAKAAASIVLTSPGLLGILAAVKTSRCVYQHMRTYTLNTMIKTIQVAVFLTLSFFLLRQFVITPTLIVLLLFANDFVTMSIAADHATPLTAGQGS